MDIIMDEHVKELFVQKNTVFIATLMKDGSPQLSPVWANLEDDHIMINTAEGRIKHKNVLRDPRVAVSVVSHDNSTDMTSIRGTVVELIPDYDYSHVDKLAKKYMGLDRYPYRKEGEKRVVLKIKPDSVYVMPKLVLNKD